MSNSSQAAEGSVVLKLRNATTAFSVFPRILDVRRWPTQCKIDYSFSSSSKWPHCQNIFCHKIHENLHSYGVYHDRSNNGLNYKTHGFNQDYVRVGHVSLATMNFLKTYSMDAPLHAYRAPPLTNNRGAPPDLPHVSLLLLLITKMSTQFRALLERFNRPKSRGVTIDTPLSITKNDIWNSDLNFLSQKFRIMI